MNRHPFLVGNLILFAIVTLVVRFRNPALTETQLFLRFWYWWAWGAVLAAIFVLRRYGPR